MGDYFWMIRPDHQDEDVEYSIVYAGEPRLFSLKIHHGGEFILKPKIRYIKGKVNFVDCCALQYFDRDILEEMVKNVGYPPDMVFYFHFKLPDKSFETDLRVIDNHHVCNLMFNYVATGHKLLDIYVEHDECRIPDYRVVGKAKYLASLDRQKRNPIEETEQFDDECENGFEILEEGKFEVEQNDATVECEDDYDDEYSTDEELPSSQPHEEQNDDDRTTEDEQDEDFVVDDCVVEDVEVDLKEYYDVVVSEEPEPSEVNTCAKSDVPSEFASEAIDMEAFQSNSDDLDTNSYVTFISDRQKGLIPAMSKVFPHVEHRVCLRHIHENMKKQWGGVVYKNLLWKAASATNQAKFLRVMEEIKQANVKMHEWLTQIPAIHWSRSHFSGRAQCDILLNNLCEVFNKQLVAARDKPVYTCLEYIKTYLQKRIVNVNKVISKSPGPLTPEATKLFNKIKEDASQYTVLMSGNDKYQVNGPWNDQVVVDMDSRSCTCRRWDITGMPCRHVVAVIWDMARNNMGSGVAEKYVSKVYWLQTWKDTYANNISPISGRDNWLPSMCPTTLIPPKHHKPIGRPKKARRNSVDEVHKSFTSGGKITRKGATTTCGKCGKQGHNSRGCRGQAVKGLRAAKRVERERGRPESNQVWKTYHRMHHLELRNRIRIKM